MQAGLKRIDHNPTLVGGDQTNRRHVELLLCKHRRVVVVEPRAVLALQLIGARTRLGNRHKLNLIRFINTRKYVRHVLLHTHQTNSVCHRAPLSFLSCIDLLLAI